MENLTVALISLGCDKNLVDSEVMLALLKEEGFKLTTRPDEADVIVINTCGFIESAKEESIQAILRMAAFKETSCRVLVAAGCLAQRYGERLMAQMPELDAIVGTGDTGGIAAAIRRCLSNEKVLLTAGCHGAPDNAPRLQSTPSHTAFLKIAEGCDNRCSYCVIPQIRGPYRSKALDSLLAEAAVLAAGGVREINLVAQDITLYGSDRHEGGELPALIDGLSALPGLDWIRLLYAYPERAHNLIETVLAKEKVCAYLDLPLQHADDSVLGRMGRRMTGEKMLSLLHRLRREVPGIVLRSTFIVGFPGEGEKEFRVLLDFLAEARLDRVGFFTYSREEGTPAARFGSQVPAQLKNERLRQAIRLQSGITNIINSALTGKILPVMLEGPSAVDRSVTLARSEGHAPEVDGYIRLKGIHTRAGDIIDVRITGFDGPDLLAVKE